MGTAPPGASYNETGQGMPMIAGAGDFGKENPKPKKWTSQATRIANTGDLIVCVRATIGDLNWADKEYCLGRGVAAIRARPGKADIRYLARVLEAQKQALTRLGTGSTFLALRKAEMENFQIPLPPLEEQKRIAAVLDKADALRRQRQESLQLTERLLQSTFIDMFGDPDSMPQMKLVDLLTKPLRNGLSPASGGTHKDTVFTLSAITRGSFNSEARKEAMFAAPPRPTARVNATDFLICRGNGNLRLCGKGQSPTEDAIGVVFPDTIIAASIDITRVSKDYFETLWNQPFVRRQIENGARTANGIHKVNQTTLEEIKIPLPAFDLQIEFGRIAETVVSAVKDVEASAEYMETLYLGLQQRAFQGKLDLGRISLEPEAESVVAKILPGHSYKVGVYI